MSTNTKWLVGGLGLVLLFFVGLFWLAQPRTSGPNPPVEPPPASDSKTVGQTRELPPPTPAPVPPPAVAQDVSKSVEKPLESPTRPEPTAPSLASVPPLVDGATTLAQYAALVASLEKEFKFVPIKQWKGLKFVFLEQPKAIQAYGYQSFKGGSGQYGQPTYAEAVGRVGTVTRVEIERGIYRVDLTMDDNGRVYTGDAFLENLHSMAPVADIEKARSLWKGNTLWLACPHRMSKEIPIGLQKYPMGDEFEVFAVRRFSPVKVVDVVGGSYGHAPIRFVLQTETGERGFEDCSLSGTNGWVDRKEWWWQFDDFFFMQDPRKLYRWDERTWKAIEKRSVFIGMTPEQARLSWGKPKTVNRTTTAAGTREQWVYGDNDSFLYFDDDILTTIQN